MTPGTAPFGTWQSPITAAHVGGKSLRFGRLVASETAVWWSETRPAENGRGVIVECRAGGDTRDLTPEPFSVRSRVHEYGGGEFALAGSGLVFVNGEDQDLYEIEPDGAIARLTAAPSIRFGDPCGDRGRGRVIVVAERHVDGEMPENFIAAIDLDGTATDIVRLISGAGFYASPRLSADGSRLAWLEWDLPDMPWQGARLMVARLDQTGAIHDRRHVAGGGGTSVFQPEWRDDGALFFVWNPGEWGNLHSFDGDAVTPLCVRDAEFARPQWALAMSAYALLPGGRIAAAFIEDGEAKLGVFDSATGEMTLVETGFCQIEAIAAVGENIVAVATEHTRPPAIVRIRLGDPANPVIERLRESGQTDDLAGAISSGRHVTFAGVGGRTVHAVHYPPENAGFEAPQGTLPPAIVSAHGGPTGMADRGFKPKIQYWTSRGFAFLDVDYTGSFGYGRGYRDALDGEWGIADVEDVAAGARWLAEEGLADPSRLLISGSSAGGYTVLQALVKYDLFAAGAAYYGISDLARLASLTHKFESGYIYTLFAVTPESADRVFAERSPLNGAARISSPVIFFQGSEDAVVPPEQSRAMAKSLEQRKVPVAYLEFDGEGHGFRRADSAQAAIEAEYAFYARVLGLDPIDELPPIEIANLETADR